MSPTAGLTNCLVVQTTRRNIGVIEQGMILPTLRSIGLIGQKEPSTTRDQIDALLKRLDELGVGMNGGDASLASVISAPLRLIQHSILSSTLDRIKDRLRDISDRIENPVYMGSTKGAKAVSRLMEEIRVAIANRQVSGKGLTGLAI